MHSQELGLKVEEGSQVVCKELWDHQPMFSLHPEILVMVHKNTYFHNVFFIVSLRISTDLPFWGPYPHPSLQEFLGPPLTPDIQSLSRDN